MTENETDKNNTDPLVIWIEDLDGTEKCPICNHDFNRGESVLDNEGWNDLGGYHHRSGGKTTYGCPENGCGGKITVTI